MSFWTQSQNFFDRIVAKKPTAGLLQHHKISSQLLFACVHCLQTLEHCLGASVLQLQVRCQEVTYNQGNVRSFEDAIKHQKYLSSCL